MKVGNMLLVYCKNRAVHVVLFEFDEKFNSSPVVYRFILNIFNTDTDLLIS